MKQTLPEKIEEIREFRKREGWSLRRMASEAGLSSAALNRMDCKGWNPKADTVTAIEIAMTRHEAKKF